jgi:hypothetical protein
MKWLADLVDAAEKIPIESPVGHSADHYITGSAGKKYGVGKLIGSSELSNLYECDIGDRCGILKIALETTDNPCLEREALTLRAMTAEAARLEAQNTLVEPYNYDRFFPTLIDSFVARNQNNRRVNILGFSPEIKDIGQLTPVSALTQIEKVYVDPKTGAWIIGKALKVLVFAHGQGISNGQILGNNILIERAIHGVIIFDWTSSSGQTDRTLPQELVRQDLSSIGRVATIVMGGDPSNGKLPESNQLIDDRFEEFLHQLTQGAIVSARQAHSMFYELIWNMWGREFHPYTTTTIT